MILGMFVGRGVIDFVELAPARALGNDFATGSATWRGVARSVWRENGDALSDLGLAIAGG